MVHAGGQMRKSKSQVEIQRDVFLDVALNESVSTIVQNTVPKHDVAVKLTIPDVTPLTGFVPKQCYTNN